MTDKTEVRDFWNAASCGEELYLDGSAAKGGYGRQLAIRYALEPFILDFARFRDWSGKDVLEIGVGLGADHQSFAEAGARLNGIDLTERAIEHTKSRFRLLGLRSEPKGRGRRVFALCRRCLRSRLFLGSVTSQPGHA